MWTKNRMGLWAALILTLCLLAGCFGDENLRANADKARSVSGQIREVLASNPEGEIEDSELAHLIVERLPADWQGRAQTALSGVADVRQGAIDIADQFDAYADRADAQADADGSDFENAIGSIGAAADLIFGTKGLAVILGGTVIGLWRKWKQEQATTEDIVSSIEASPAVRGVIETKEGSSQLRTSMQPSTQKTVAKIKKSIKST